MSEIVVQVEEKERPLSEVVASKLEKARSMTITDQASYNAVVEMRVQLKALRDAIEQAHAEPKKLKHAAWKAEVAAETAELAPVQEVEGVLKVKTFEWDAAQEALRRAEQARLEAEAKKKADDEALAAAEAAQKAGAAPAEVESILETPVVAPPVVAPRTYTPAPRMAGRENWTAELVSLPDVVRFVAANPAFGNLLVLNQTTANQMARAQKSMMKIPGLKARCERV